MQHSNGFGFSNPANIKMTFCRYISVDISNLLFIAFVSGWENLYDASNSYVSVWQMLFFCTHSKWILLRHSEDQLYLDCENVKCCSHWSSLFMTNNFTLLPSWEILILYCLYLLDKNQWLAFWGQIRRMMFIKLSQICSTMKKGKLYPKG